jgi:hypothetical protein
MLVLSIGQCGADDWRISQVVKTALGASIERAGSAEEARAMMNAKKYDLILVNRIFDSDGDSGIEFVSAAADGKSRLMLISDYSDAQQQAIANGALPGFGKSRMGDERTRELLRNAVQK